MNSKKIKEYAEIIISALLIAFFIRTFIVQAFTIPSGSMKPTLQIGDYLLVNKLAYGVKLPFVNKILLHFANPQRGDMVVFQFPLEHSLDFIKRIIAVPGDTVLIKNKTVFINGKPLEKGNAVFMDASVYSASFSPRDNLGPLSVPADSFFVMGDNRDHSNDSRFWGLVKREEIAGKALIIYWSWDSDEFKPRWERLGRLLK
jgi:signal peptidase I